MFRIECNSVNGTHEGYLSPDPETYFRVYISKEVTSLMTAFGYCRECGQEHLVANDSDIDNARDFARNFL